jgi:hypothetical protein
MNRITVTCASIVCLLAITMANGSTAQSETRHVAIGQKPHIFSMWLISSAFGVVTLEDEPPPPITDAVSREFAVFVGFTGPALVDDGVSREFTIFVGFTGPVPVDDAVSREFALCVGNRADLNCDGVVDGADLLILLSSWGECANPSVCPADLNDDGTVDGADLLILLSNWG